MIYSSVAMPDSAYDLICKRECQWCAKGSERLVPESAITYHRWDGSYVGACTAPTPLAVIDRLTAQVAGMQEALAQAPHAEGCAFREWECSQPNCGKTHSTPCNCYLSTLSDAISRGRELLEKERELAELKGTK